MERMARWLELLAKYRHMAHLQIQDSHLDTLQYFCVDVILFLAALVAAWLWMAAQVLARMGFRWQTDLTSKPAAVRQRKGSRGRTKTAKKIKGQ